MNEASDPYLLTAEGVEAPPQSLSSAIGRIGPGMVLAASIVGSGELIATTTLGAQVGFAALWIVLVSCAVKPVVQAELGRYTIVTGHTALEGFDRIPGPRLGAGWMVWAWALMLLLTMVQIGGIYGGAGQVLHLLVPQVAVGTWVGVCLVVTVALLLGGGYARVERLALIKVGSFTLLTVCAAAVLLRRADWVTAQDLLDGFSLDMPTAGLATAVAVFGLTGVGAAELVQYPYWCVEKGYARYVGPRDGSAAWSQRARGWLRVMHLDILCSLLIYTLATVAFYLLGAGVLHRIGLVPAQRDTIEVLSRLYTETLGGWALWLFYAGAVITLYGTILAVTAAHSRMLADALRVGGVYAREDVGARRWWGSVFVIVLSSLPPILYWMLASPVQMVLAEGLGQAAMLPLIGTAAIYLRRRYVPKDVQSGTATWAMLWIATGVMGAAAAYYLAEHIR